MSDTPTLRPLTGHELRRVSVRATCDPRTVTAYLRGESQGANMVARVERALRSCGFERYVRGFDAKASRGQPEAIPEGTGGSRAASSEPSRDAMRPSIVSARPFR